jgi:hypothetical protein
MKKLFYIPALLFVITSCDMFSNAIGGLALNEKPQRRFAVSSNNMLPREMNVSHYYSPDGWMGDWPNLKVPYGVGCRTLSANVGEPIGQITDDCITFRFKPMSTPKAVHAPFPVDDQLVWKDSTLDPQNWVGVYWLMNKNWGSYPPRIDKPINPKEKLVRYPGYGEGNKGYVSFWARCHNSGQLIPGNYCGLLEVNAGGSGTNAGGMSPKPFGDIFGVKREIQLTQAWGCHYMELPEKTDIYEFMDDYGIKSGDVGSVSMEYPFHLVGAFAWAVKVAEGWMTPNDSLTFSIDRIRYSNGIPQNCALASEVKEEGNQ